MQTTCRDSLGHTLHVCAPDACPYWLCPHCGGHCTTIGQRSARPFGRTGTAPLIRCGRCAYRAVIDGPSANDFVQRSPAEQTAILTRRAADRAQREAEWETNG